MDYEKIGFSLLGGSAQVLCIVLFGIKPDWGLAVFLAIGSVISFILSGRTRLAK